MMYFAPKSDLVSEFSMMAVKFVMAVRKRRSINATKACSAAPGQIVRMFVYQGMILGFVGLLLGIRIEFLAVGTVIQEPLREIGFDVSPSPISPTRSSP